jgi:predicted ferric reductase
MVSTVDTAAERAARRRPRPGHAPKPGFADALAALAGLGLGVVLGLVVTGESRGSLAAPGGWLIAGGRLAGFGGAYLILVMVVLIARLPWLERAVGQDRLVRWHRRIAPWALALISSHVVLITLGYARSAKVGVLHQLWVFITSYPDILAAAVGFGLLVMAGITSVRIARRHLKYETWWIVHLYTYLALALAFAHQISTGGSFVAHPLTRAVWIAVWVLSAGVVVLFRVVLPIGRSLRHQLRVAQVREEAPGVFSVICSGRRLDRLAVSGGQFFRWRFLTKELWWHAHPYSLSALPQPPYLRVTIKGRGDQSRAIAALRPGTRVAIEGPYGAFTHHMSTTERVTLVGAGVGITPLRALLEDLPASVDVTLIVRGSAPADIMHREELRSLVEHHHGRFYEVIGTRHEVQLDARMLRGLVPDLAARDLYVCGPGGFSDDIVAAARRLGVPPAHIHEERFEF